MKYFNFKRYKFSTVTKKLNTLRHGFLKIFKLVDFKRYDFKNIFKYIDIKKYHFPKITESFYFKLPNLNQLKKIKFTKNRFLVLHLPVSIIFFSFLYIAIPTLYNYDSSVIEKQICKNQKIECLIRGKINYVFYPTPRLKIRDLIVYDFFDRKKILMSAKEASIKLSFKNLLAMDKHEFKKLKLINYEINFNLKNIKDYKKILTKRISFIPTDFKKGKFIFFDGKEYVGHIKDVNIDLKSKDGFLNAELNGELFNDNLFFSLKNKKNEDKFSTDIILKMSNMKFITKANIFHPTTTKDILSGNILVKNGKNRLTAIFDYKDGTISINKSNIRNVFLDGKLEGKLKFLPFFGFNLDLNLNNINLSKIYTYFLSLDEKDQKDLFNISKKINGKLNLSTNKIYSKSDLLKSFESRIKFNNGNIFIDQFLISLGKLGAADILGTFDNNKKFTSFKFESNIFVDNKKKFLRKFGIYNKTDILSNLFISGSFDLDKQRLTFYEISDNEKLKNDDVNYIEEEFNNLMLEDGYASLFHFSKFKEFIKSISSEIN
tara:strand:+ start:2163 stop:3800 length:1638 start_codon:yes stop_codon:yes gene_type:complete